MSNAHCSCFWSLMWSVHRREEEKRNKLLFGQYERTKKPHNTQKKTTSDDCSNQSIDLWLSLKVGLVYYCFKWFPSLIDCQWSYYWYYKCKKVKKTKLQWKKNSYVFFEQHQMSKLTILFYVRNRKKRCDKKKYSMVVFS